MMWLRVHVVAFAGLLLSGAFLSSNAQAQCPAYSGQWEIPNSPWIKPMALDGLGNVYVADATNSRIVKCTGQGTLLTEWGSAGTDDGQFASLGTSGFTIAIDGSDNVYVLDGGNNRVQKFTSSGTYVLQWPLQPDTSSLANYPSRPVCIAVDRGGNYVYVTDLDTYHVLKYTASGEFVTKWGSVGHDNGQFWHGPAGVAVDEAGNVYVAEAGQDVQVFTGNGDFVTRWTGDPWSLFWGITIDKTGNVYVIDNGDGPCCPSLKHRVKMFSSSGAFLCEWGSFGSDDGQFMWPYYVAVDGAGSVYVSDSDSRIQRFGPAPVPTRMTTWGGLKAAYR